MYCPKCRTLNKNDAQVCKNSACAFDFSNPAAYPDDSSFLSKIFHKDKWLFNIIFVVFALFVLVVVFSGYITWNAFAPSPPRVLAIREVEDKSQIYVLNWLEGKSLLLGESEGTWFPSIHLATSDQLARQFIQRQYWGYWNGGSAILLPELEKTILTLRQENRWQVNLVDLETGNLSILTESVGVEPFISIAPVQNLAAISIPATSEKMATLQVFSLVDGKEISQPVSEALITKGILSSNGEYLLYTATLTKTDVNTDTDSLYSTALYIANINGEDERLIYRFNHYTPEQVPDDYFYNFTPNNQSIVYQSIKNNQLNRVDIRSQISTDVFTPTQNMILSYAQATPDSDHLVLFLANEQNPNQAELHLVSLETTEDIVLEETVQLQYATVPIFLDHEQILYSPAPGKQVIFNISTNSKKTISNSEDNLSPPLLANDLGLIAFVLSGKGFKFFSPLQKDFVKSLDLEEIVSDNDSSIVGLNFDMNHLIFRQGDGLYLKDISNNLPPTLLTDKFSEYYSTYFTSNPRYLLYTAISDNVTNIYRIDLQNHQNRLLMENARLLHQ